MLTFTRDQTLLFIGDSITDCGRRTDEPEKLGNGYVRIVRDWLCARDPSNAPRVVNMGISGNKMGDLEKRWQRDVIDVRPDVLSVYIGINDVWHGFKPDRLGTTIKDFTRGYREILTRTRDAFPACKFVVCEPSVIWLAAQPDANELLQPYVEASRIVAKEFDAIATVPLHGAFVDAQAARPDVPWAPDGVHPSSTGHALIARTWLKSVGLI
jgi:acyl-CoA thioesterase-1